MRGNLANTLLYDTMRCNGGNLLLGDYEKTVFYISCDYWMRYCGCLGNKRSSSCTATRKTTEIIFYGSMGGIGLALFKYPQYPHFYRYLLGAFATHTAYV